MSNFQERLLRAIPGGAHTYSRGADQFPSNAPEILASGKGCYVTDPEKNTFLDYGMALRANILGYADSDIDQAAFKQMQHGNNLTRASLIELEAAETLIDLIPCVEMVKFTKNGSTAVSAAVKIARAATGHTLVARCADHPFFSFDDWFIGSTPLTKGIPETVQQQTLTFPYNDIEALRNLVDEHQGQLACIVLEAATTAHPAPSKTHEGETFLHDVQRLCRQEGIVFILDEMITGFRWHLQGASSYYNISPDLCTFGKAMANGYSVAAVAGKRELMELGNIVETGQERLFLLSTTHGAEMCGLGAFVATVKKLKQRDVIPYIWQFGQQLINEANQLITQHQLQEYIRFDGIPCSPFYLTYDCDKSVSMEYRTLFSQEMIKQGVLMPWLALSYAHGTAELEKTLSALEHTLKVYQQALEQDVSAYLVGESIKPVFRKYN